MKKIQEYIIVTLFLLSILYSVVQVAVNLKEEVVSDRSDILWGFIFIILVAIWVQKDAQASKKQYPFEYGYFAYLLWPIVVPYHLISTRGSEGALQLMGFFMLYSAPFISGLVAYVYFT
jgi:hypothetical protein